MAEYTKGPWSVGHTSKRSYRMAPDQFEVAVHVGIGANRGNCLAIVYMGGSGAIDGSQEAVEVNARLIAAAPELLEALMALRRFMWAEGYADQTPGMALADAAIAKAEASHA